MGPAAPGAGDVLGGISCKVHLFSLPKEVCQDQGPCQSSEQGKKEGEEGTWGRCPLPSTSLHLHLAAGSS